MPDFLEDLPFGVVFAALAVGAMCRGQIMYWLGRVATEQTLARTHPTGGWRARTHRWLSAGGADAGIVAIRRWGLIAIPFSYVTIGLQSMIQAGAGVLRIEWWKYTLAQIPGALAWGAIYATFGFFTWRFLGEAIRGNPLAAGGLALLTALLIGALVLIRRRSGDVAEALEQLADDESTDPASPSSASDMR